MSVDGENEGCIGSSTLVRLSIRIHLRAQAPVHEASFLETHPPLARFTRPIHVQLFDEPSSEFLADLY
jgi:hypothetical protein